jgi:protein O-GlcNAc transferase
MRRAHELHFASPRREGTIINGHQHLLEAATQSHREGNLVEARRGYCAVLAIEPDHPLALFRCGLLELQERHPEVALGLLSQAARAAPDNSHYQLGIGQALQSLGRWSEAAEVYGRVVALEPESADAHFALGVALQSQSQHESAVNAFERALQWRPDFADALNNLGMSRQLLKHHAAAQSAYRAALALRPDDARTLGNLGALLREMGHLEEAVTLLRQALMLESASTSHAINLALALGQRREFDAAASLLKDALMREPQNAAAAFNLGNMLRALGDLAAALVEFKRAVAMRPDYAEAWSNLGITYKELGQPSSALEAFEAALRVQPNDVVALNNLGCLLRNLGRLDEAENALRRGLAIDGRHAALHDNLGNVLKDGGELDAAVDCYREALNIKPDSPATHCNLAYALSFQSMEAGPVREECVRWNDRFAAPWLPRQTRSSLPHVGQKLRIGYVSADFREHCQSLFTTPLFAHHDRAAFEIICYSSVERSDATTRRIAALVDGWRDVRALDDAELSALIRQDGIDVLVDLTMHMSDNRLLVFARRAAPVQISWLAYPGTTGMTAIDYRLSDPRLDPPGFDSHYTERTLRLPDSFWCYDPLTDGPAVGPLPAMQRGHVTFGCLNNPCKLTDATLQLWGAVLRVSPSARLVLLAPEGRHRERLRQRLEAQDIGAARVDFIGYRPRQEYLHAYHDIDLSLDTIPYNGHTTSLDGLWMGVPTVTRVGNTAVGRGGLSQLFQLDLLDFVAETDDAFVARAVSLASDWPRLATLRGDLRSRMQNSALMNGPRFARSVEAAFRHAWASRLS